MRKDIKVSCQKRLSRIEGQVRGLSKMVDEDRYCIDIVTQISAVRAALRRVEEEVLKDHVSHCVEHAITSGNKADQREKIAELMAACHVDRSAAFSGSACLRSVTGMMVMSEQMHQRTCQQQHIGQRGKDVPRMRRQQVDAKRGRHER
jgi:DNA-binding FrmR family transcriptional regulator